MLGWIALNKLDGKSHLTSLKGVDGVIMIVENILSLVRVLLNPLFLEVSEISVTSSVGLGGFELLESKREQAKP